MEPALAEPVSRRALLVGIEAYGRNNGWPKLRGPRQDVESMRSALEFQGFEPEDIHLLLDAQATRAGILAAFDDLIQASQEDDVLLFYFAGHGSSVPDLNGDELDGFDETLVPFDASLPDGRPNDLLDDDLREMIARANKHTEHVVFIFDCCSSGTNVRGSQTIVARYVDPTERGLAGIREGSAPPASADAISSYLESGASYVALSACRSNQSAFEVGVPNGSGQTVMQGLFTYHLVDEMRAGGALSYERLLARVRDRIRGLRNDQTPLAEGPLAARALFGREAGELPSSFPIEQSDSGSVLKAGRVNGLEAGAVLSVFDSPESAGNAAQALGRIELKHVGSVASTFMWLGSETDAPAQGRLWAVAAVTDLVRLGFAILATPDPQAGLDLSLELKRTGLLRETNLADAELVLQLLPDSKELQQDGAPASTSSESNSDVTAEAGAGQVPPSMRWTVRTRQGVELPLSADASQKDEVEAMTAALARLGRSHRVMKTVNRQQDSHLKVETAIELLNKKGEVLGTLEQDANGMQGLTQDQRFGCRLVNRSPVPIYATLLAISPDGEIYIITRPENLDDAVPPGGTLKSPRMRLVLKPGNSAFYRSGSECFRWVITSEFHDLRNLRQDACNAPLTRGAADAATTGTLNELGGESWLTASSSVRLILPD